MVDSVEGFCQIYKNTTCELVVINSFTYCLSEVNKCMGCGVLFTKAKLAFIN